MQDINRGLIDKWRARFGDLWWYSLLNFFACRSGDLIQAFIGLWLVPRFVPQDELGAALPILQIGTVFGLPLAILVIPFSRWLTIFAARGEKGKVKRLLSITLVGVAVAFLIATVFARFLIPVCFKRLYVAKGSLGILMVCAGLIVPFSTVFTNALQGLKRYTAMAVYSLIVAPFRLVVMLVAMPFRALSGYVLGQMSGPALSVAFSCFALRKDLGRDVKSVRLDREDVRAMVKYTFPISIYLVVGTLIGTWQLLLFRQRLPMMESAAYYIISRFGEVTAYASMALMAVSFPMAVEASQNGKDGGRILFRVLLGSLGTGLFVSIVLLLWGKSILGLIPLWQDYVPYSGLLAAYAFRMTICAGNGAFYSYETATGNFAFLRYWLPLTLIETGTLVVLTGCGAFEGILPDELVGWMASLHAARLSFFVWWLLALSLMQAVAIGLHLWLRHRFAMTGRSLPRVATAPAGRGRAALS